MGRAVQWIQAHARISARTHIASCPHPLRRLSRRPPCRTSVPATHPCSNCTLDMIMTRSCTAGSGAGGWHNTRCAWHAMQVCHAARSCAAGGRCSARGAAAQLQGCCTQRAAAAAAAASRSRAPRCAGRPDESRPAPLARGKLGSQANGAGSPEGDKGTSAVHTERESFVHRTNSDEHVRAARAGCGAERDAEPRKAGGKGWEGINQGVPDPCCRGGRQPRKAHGPSPKGFGGGRGAKGLVRGLDGGAGRGSCAARGC